MTRPAPGDRVLLHVAGEPRPTRAYVLQYLRRGREVLLRFDDAQFHDPDHPHRRLYTTALLKALASKEVRQ